MIRVESGEKRRHGARLDLGVAIEEEDDLSLRPREPDVRCARQARPGRAAEHRDMREAGGQCVASAVGAGVVHDEDLQGLPRHLERGDAAHGQLASVVRRHDHGQAWGYQPEHRGRGSYTHGSLSTACG
jgi:hypothetical protein